MGLVAVSSDLGQVLGPLLASGILLWRGSLESVFSSAIVVACLGLVLATIIDRQRTVGG